ncbi:MAG: class I SAM-dependent methyltransferase [Actinomycetota bacterium]|nr:class I SAM-dependent methyltransferase [Actinomycetota bacterium]
MSPVSEQAIWHDIECGHYEADMPLWRELAACADGPILEIGAGTGRIALDLARRGHRVVAVEIEPELATALRSRAAALPIDVVCADITDGGPAGTFALILAPMQVIQVLGGRRERLAMLRHARACLRPGGSLVVAFVETVGDTELAFGPSDLTQQEDTLVLDRSTYTSRAISVRFSRRAIQIVRERRTRGPAGGERRSRSHQVLDVLTQARVIAEAADAGLSLRRIHEIPGSDHDSACSAIAFGAEP